MFARAVFVVVKGEPPEQILDRVAGAFLSLDKAQERAAKLGSPWYVDSLAAIDPLVDKLLDIAAEDRMESWLFAEERMHGHEQHSAQELDSIHKHAVKSDLKYFRDEVLKETRSS
jgi:hypothetical protein